MSKAKRDVSRNPRTVESQPATGLITGLRGNGLLEMLAKLECLYDTPIPRNKKAAEAHLRDIRALELLIEVTEPRTQEEWFRSLEHHYSGFGNGEPCGPINYSLVAAVGSYDEIQHAENVAVSWRPQMMLRAYKALFPEVARGNQSKLKLAA